MSIKKVLRRIGIVVISLLILYGGLIVYNMTGDYIIYSIKTVGQEKHKLTVYAEYGGTKKPSSYTAIEVVQKIGHAKDTEATRKEITYRATNRNGIAVFYLPPGTYHCQEKGSSWEYNYFVDLNSDKEIKIEIIPLMVY